MAQAPSLADAREVRIARQYPVGPEKVWRAWTDPQALSAWFGPGDPKLVSQADLDVRPGGAYAIRFRSPDGQDNGVSGRYEEVVPHERLVFSWAWQSTPERVSRVTVLLRAVAGGTEMELIHDRFFDAAACDNHRRGWTWAMQNFDAALMRG